jgi:hypothetical protein
MAVLDLVKRGKKENNNKSGKKAAKAQQRHVEAQARQARYDKLTLAQKLAQPHLGAKERAKLMAKKGA